MIRSPSIFIAFPICSESCFGKRVKNYTAGPGEMPGPFLFWNFFISDYAQLFTKIVWFFCLFLGAQPKNGRGSIKMGRAEVKRAARRNKKIGPA